MEGRGAGAFRDSPRWRVAGRRRLGIRPAGGPSEVLAWSLPRSEALGACLAGGALRSRRPLSANAAEASDRAEVQSRRGRRPPVAPHPKRRGARPSRGASLQATPRPGRPMATGAKRPCAAARPFYTHPAARSTTDDVRTQWNALPTRNAKPQPSGTEEVKYSLKPVSLAPKVQERGSKQRE